MSKNTFILLFLTLFYFSCGQKNRTEEIDTETTVVGNITTTISEDKEKLGKLINLKTYEPTSVKFKYQHIDNSGAKDRSVPGPSDYYLQAVMQYDSATYNTMRNNYLNLSVELPNIKKEDFLFDWLDESTKNELTTASGFGALARYYTYAEKGKVWVMKNKILFYESSQ